MISKKGQNPIEKIHLKFCKLYLGVNRKASKIVSRVLSKFVQLLPIVKRTLNYINHLNQLPDKTTTFYFQKSCTCNSGKESCYSNIMNTITSCYDTSN